MAKSSTGLWFDLFVLGGMTEDPISRERWVGHKKAVSSLLIKNVHFGNFHNNWGADAVMGFWEWIPRCVETSEKICGIPLPEEWTKTVRGGWHWEMEKKGRGTRFRAPSRFMALTQDKPLGRKIGAVDGFKIDDFRGYDQSQNPRDGGAWKFTGDQGFWVINDGKFRLSGTWRFINLISG